MPQDDYYQNLQYKVYTYYITFLHYTNMFRDTGFHRSCIKFISHQNLFFMQSISKYLMSTHLHKALGCTGLFLFFFFSYPVVNTDSKLNLNSFYELLVCLCFPPSDEPGSLGNFNE